MLLHSSTEVIDTIVARLLNATGPIAVMAGHFSLVHHRQTGKLVPGVIDDIEDEATRNFVAQHHYMGSFPLETWNAGIEIVKRLRSAGRDAKLLVLVNDWQHVDSAPSGQRNADRDAFFANPILPPALRLELAANGLNDSDLVTDVRDGKPCIFWCESRLRSRYHRHMKLSSPCGKLMCPGVGAASRANRGAWLWRFRGLHSRCLPCSDCWRNGTRERISRPLRRIHHCLADG